MASPTASSDLLTNYTTRPRSSESIVSWRRPKRGAGILQAAVQPPISSRRFSFP